MRLSLRFIIPLLIAIAAFAYAAVPLADALMERWFVRDLDIRSGSIAAAVQDPVNQLIATGSDPKIMQFFNRMLQDERLYALGLCLDARATPVATALFPRTLDCAAIEKDDDVRHVLRSGKGLLHVAVRRFDTDSGTPAWLALVHDMSLIARRNEVTRQYLFYFFIALGAAIALITVVIAQISWRGWVRGLRSLLRGEGLLRPASNGGTAPELRPIARDLRELIRDLERQYRPLDGSQRIWDQQALRATLRSELHGNDVIVVSNREPYIHVRTDGGIRLQPRHRARARDARVLGHLDRTRERLGRPRDRRPPRPHRGAAGTSALPGAPHLAQQGGGGRLLFRLRERGLVAALPHRPRAADVPVARFRAVPSREP